MPDESWPISFPMQIVHHLSHDLICITTCGIIIRLS